MNGIFHFFAYRSKRLLRCGKILILQPHRGNLVPNGVMMGYQVTLVFSFFFSLYYQVMVFRVHLIDDMEEKDFLPFFRTCLLTCFGDRLLVEVGILVFRLCLCLIPYSSWWCWFILRWINISWHPLLILGNVAFAYRRSILVFTLSWLQFSYIFCRSPWWEWNKWIHIHPCRGWFESTKNCCMTLLLLHRDLSSGNFKMSKNF